MVSLVRTQFRHWLAIGTVGFASGVIPACGATTERPPIAQEFSLCDGPGQCTALTSGCCAPCGKPTLGHVQGVNIDRQPDFRAATCGDPDPGCPACATQLEPNLQAFCSANRCSALDIRAHAYSECASDTDCTLRYADCCGSCVPDVAKLIALSQAHLLDYGAAVCKPDQCLPACVQVMPERVRAVCATGHCAVLEDPGICPATAPFQIRYCGQPGTVCEYGHDVRTNCRTRANCFDGYWMVNAYECPPLPGPGQEGCPASVEQASGTCTSGLLCDMGGGNICACGQCAGGPCSLDPHWSCAAPPTATDCPAILPELGTACPSEALHCTYGVCGSESSAGRLCSGGYWRDDPVTCPT